MKPVVGVLFCLVQFYVGAYGKECDNLPPGINKLIFGVDVTKLDLFNPNDYENIEDGFKEQVLDFTCDEGKKWRNAFSRNRSEVYDFPDQLEYIRDSTGTSFNVAKLFLDLDSRKQAMAKAVLPDGGRDFMPGMFSNSWSLMRTQQRLSNDSRQFEAERTTVKRLYQVMISTIKVCDSVMNGSLSANFLKFVENDLPQKYLENPKQFALFFKYYGTHYFEKGYFGGVCKESFLIDKTLLQEKGSYQIEKWTSSRDSDYGTPGMTLLRKHSRYSEKFFGGQKSVPVGETLKSLWDRTLYRYPWLNGGSVSPLSDLLPKGPKTEAIIEATAIYIRKAHLQELKRTLNSLPSSEDSQKWILKVDDLMREVVPEEKQVKQIRDWVKAYRPQEPEDDKIVYSYGPQEATIQQLMDSAPNLREDEKTGSGDGKDCKNHGYNNQAPIKGILIMHLIWMFIHFTSR